MSLDPVSSRYSECTLVGGGVELDDEVDVGVGVGVGEGDGDVEVLKLDVCASTESSEDIPADARDMMNAFESPVKL